MPKKRLRGAKRANPSKRGAPGRGHARTVRAPVDVFVPTKRPPSRAADVEVFIPLRRAPRGVGVEPKPEYAELDRVGSTEAQALWACEPADARSFDMLKPEGESALSFQSRRNVVANPHCPERIPRDRRRCMRCPFWGRHPDLYPF